MRVVLDGSVVYDSKGAAFKYFQGLLPRLLQQTDLSLEVLPSPTGVLDGLIGRGERRQDLWARVQRKAGAVLRRWRMASGPPALFHSYYYTQAPAKQWPALQLVHDLIPEKFEQDFQSPADREFRRRKKLCFESASHFIAVSENTRQDLCQLFGIAPERVDVVPQGVDAAYFAADISAEEKRQTLAQYGIDRPYFLQVGGRMHHKNFARALEAFAMGGFAKEMLFVCAGEWISPEERSLIASWGIKDSIRHAHWPTEARLRVLFREARGLIYPSLYEGFGVPPLEAMASSTPVAASRVASIPEVCGDAVAYFDPMNPRQIARAMESLCDNRTARELVEKGRARVRLFTWDRVAAETAAVYRKLLGKIALAA